MVIDAVNPPENIDSVEGRHGTTGVADAATRMRDGETGDVILDVRDVDPSKLPISITQISL